jgi:hypothetical protein
MQTLRDAVDAANFDHQLNVSSESSVRTHHLANTSSPFVAPRRGSRDDALVGREVVGATDGLAERGVREDARLTSRASRSASLALLRGSILAGRTCWHVNLRCVRRHAVRSARGAVDHGGDTRRTFSHSKQMGGSTSGM